MLFSSDSLGKVLAGAATIAVAAGIALAVNVGNNSGNSESLITSNNNKTTYNPNLSRSLAYEIKNGNLENVKMLVDQGANPNFVVNCEIKKDVPISSFAVLGLGSRLDNNYDRLDPNRFNVAYYLLPMLNKKVTQSLLYYLLDHPKTNDYVRQLYYKGYLDNFSNEEKRNYYIASYSYVSVFFNGNNRVVIPEFKRYVSENDLITLQLPYEYEYNLKKDVIKERVSSLYPSIHELNSVLI